MAFKDYTEAELTLFEARKIQSVLDSKGIQNDDLDDYIRKLESAPSGEVFDGYNQRVDTLKESRSYDTWMESSQELIRYYDTHREELSKIVTDIEPVRRAIESNSRIKQQYDLMTQALASEDLNTALRHARQMKALIDEYRLPENESLNEFIKYAEIDINSDDIFKHFIRLAKRLKENGSSFDERINNAIELRNYYYANEQVLAPSYSEYIREVEHALSGTNELIEIMNKFKGNA